MVQYSQHNMKEEPLLCNPEEDTVEQEHNLAEGSLAVEEGSHSLVEEDNFVVDKPIIYIVAIITCIAVGFIYTNLHFCYCMCAVKEISQSTKIKLRPSKLDASLEASMHAYYFEPHP